jgi:DNA-binding transcriptional regulator GbsR (MarR family)
MTLPPITQKFVSHFGEMGSNWGINRTVGQIYALLYLSETPLVAEQISESLGFSRSNVSIGLKELQSWRLVKMHHNPGDRREHFSSLGDVWDIFRTVAAERHRREVEPTATMLRQALLASPCCEAEIHAQEQIRKMNDLFDLANTWFGEVQNLSPEELVRLMKLGIQVKNVLAMADKLTFKKARTASEDSPNIEKVSGT